MINIVTVNWNSYEFLWLLIESLERFSTIPYELFVIDNSERTESVRSAHVHQFIMPTNIGHGRGLNHGCAKSFELFPHFPFIMFLDVDCHILTYRWESMFIGMMKYYDLVGARGVPSKPIRPACMFMKKQFAKYDWSPTDGYKGNRVTPGGYDVAIKAYYKIMADGHSLGFLESQGSRYQTLNGEEYTIDGCPVVYHHWHGTSLGLPCRQADFPDADLIADKQLLFSKIPWRLP